MKSLLVHLRPIEEADLAKVRRWRNHPEVSRYMYTQHEVSQAEHLAWFQRSQEDPFRHLLVCEYGGESFGFVNIHLENPDAQRATWGFYLDPLSPRGRGQALGHAALVYAFEELKLHKLCGEALAYNERSLRFHRSLGFTRESHLRDHHFDGQYFHDVIGFGLLRSEWLAHRGA